MGKHRNAPEPDLKRVEQIIARHQEEKWPLIPLLQEIQEEFGYIPPEAIQPIARAFHLFSPQEFQSYLLYQDHHIQFHFQMFFLF